jgi:hypothetical protein
MQTNKLELALVASGVSIRTWVVRTKQANDINPENAYCCKKNQTRAEHLQPPEAGAKASRPITTKLLWLVL